jgi:predicted GIY-YIG superfamily endonuclease
VDFTGFAFDRDFLARIPPAPGVYLMKNRSGEIIYVGKADNLRRRVRSYFTSRALKDAKTARIHGQLHSLELLTCATGVEALLLEMRMIRDFRPPVNFQTEIHEQPGRYGNTRNLLLLVPVGDNAEVYLVKDGAFVARHSIPLGRPPSKKLSSRIRAVYFGTRRRTAAKRENWETEIVARWLAAHKRRLNYVDADESGDCASVLRRLTCLLMDPDRLARKVYYR